MGDTVSLWITIALCVAAGIFLLFTIWSGIVMKLPNELSNRAARAETAKKIWDEADRKGCSVSDLPDISPYEKVSFSATQAVRWAGKSTLRVVLEYWKLRRPEENLRRERRRALQRDMKARSRKI